MRNKKHVAVIGAGVAGLTASDELARFGIHVSLFEKTPFLGGHVIRLNCKATDACVKCGACIAEEKLKRAAKHHNIKIWTSTEIEKVVGNGPYDIIFRSHLTVVNSDRCDGCGICLPKCPVPGALLSGHAPRVGAYVAIQRELCRFFIDAACSVCRDVCPQKAIELSQHSFQNELCVDAILIASGFMSYNPSGKPYGYGQFEDVITSLEAEQYLQTQMILKRPSNNEPARRIAFIQCVGSRDRQLGHPWCSKICCGNSLTMARLLQFRFPDVQITLFYIDLQSFGKDFERFYDPVKDKISMIRAIPGEITKSDQDNLRLVYFDTDAHSSKEAFFDLVVLSVGLLPSSDNPQISDLLNWPQQNTGFIYPHDKHQKSSSESIFTAGAVMGPMNITESVSSAEKAVYDIVRYLAKSN